jgi:hypothetical protein
MHNFPPESVQSVIVLRDTLLNYAGTYPVRVGRWMVLAASPAVHTTEGHAGHEK